MAANSRDGAAAAQAAPQTRSQLAQALIQAVLEQARKRSLRLCVAVVDAGGHLLAFHRMDGLPFQLIGIAQDKAVTAAGFGIATHELSQGLERHPKGTREFFAARPGVVLLAGGLPLLREGELLGGLGISGGSAIEDEACAQAALQACLGGR